MWHGRIKYCGILYDLGACIQFRGQRNIGGVYLFL